MKSITEPLLKHHNRKDFCCGNNLIDNYFQKQAMQDVKRKLSACFILKDQSTDKTIAFYTLSANSINSKLIPSHLANKLPESYKRIPVTLLGRFAVHSDKQSLGIGKTILIDALLRAYETSKSVASFAIIVDPINDVAEAFYNHYGFIKLPDSGKMFLPMKTIEALFNKISK